MVIAQGVQMLDIRQDNMRVYPVFLWDERCRVLVDTGFPGQLELFERALPPPFHLSDLTHIIFTHQDMDHIGGARDIRLRAPRAEILAHSIEAPYIQGDQTPVKLAQMEQNLDSLSPERREKLPGMKSAFAAHTVPVDVLLSDGDVLDFCGGIEVIHTPGHTPGHICLYLRESKTLITGDALHIADGGLAGAEPMYTLDMALSWASIELLSRFPAEAVVSYHEGLLREDIRAEIQKLLRSR